MSIGIDFGTTQFRSMRLVDETLVGRQCPAIYAVLADKPNHRKLLEQSRTPFAVCGHELVLFGEHASEWASILNLVVSPLLPGGRVPQSDGVARQILGLIVDAVLPRAERLGDICCLTVPAGSGAAPTEESYDSRFFKQLVALRGYQPKLISSGQAVVLAELASSAFSGIGISLGMGSCQVAVIHCGREMATCSFDATLIDAVASNEPESFTGRDEVASDQQSRVVSAANRVGELTRLLVQARDELSRRDVFHWLAQPTHVVCTGRPVSETGFRLQFVESWENAAWPIRVAEIRMATDPVYSVARGCLIQSRLENRDDLTAAA